MPLYDFGPCYNGHTIEERTSSEVKQIDCPCCGEPAQRQFPVIAHIRPVPYRWQECTSADLAPDFARSKWGGFGK